MLGKVFGMSLMLLSVAIFVTYTFFIFTIFPEFKKAAEEMAGFNFNDFLPTWYPLLSITLPGLALCGGLAFITYFIDSTHAKIAEAKRLKEIDALIDKEKKEKAGKKAK
jgi:hypothetical protein